MSDPPRPSSVFLFPPSPSRPPSPCSIGDRVSPLEGAMHRAKLLVLAAIAALPLTTLAQNNVTVFEGARVIVGDGRAPIENATVVVTGNRFTAVGRASDVRVPAGATRVNLAGKTVMPSIIDTHNHLSQTREMLINDLKLRPYYGVTASQSMGQDTMPISFQIREETREGKIPGAARHHRR